ncbi:NUDIX hydrolase [Fodinibius salsisoli]|uniref:NUDIX domain-containing protein n=1 Tax=Fodinibius salsisoli TaxID=2820877 RepID=A0ABT3PHV2_9BACT|nr:NUDIX domain-containing protein [Fodinibius salsisoli]MCW9705494.1 NUDIX domain-containing protein [Fodinibius salsisoli]
MEVDEGIKRNAVLCVLACDQQYLLLKRFRNPNKGLFTPIGGKLDPHENPRQAAIRETYEETGIELVDLTYCGTLVETSPTDYNWNSYVYTSEISFREPPDCDEGILHWISRGELTEIPTPVTDRYIYQFIADDRPFMLNADYDENLQMLSLREEIQTELLISNSL